MLTFILQRILGRYARLVIRRYQPQIIGITGSVGKTSTKEATARVLSRRFSLRETYKNYNNELGLPLTILGEVSPGKSIAGWLRVFAKARKLIREKNNDYPQALVLEMGVDRPGDMDYLTKIIQPSRAIITKLGQAHLEFFSSLEQLHTEKFKIAKALPDNGVLVYNGDDENARRHADKIQCNSLSFGFGETCDVRADAVSVSFSEEAVSGISFKMEYQGSSVPVFLPGAIGRPAVYAALAAAAVGLSYGMNSLEISEALRDFKQPAGRLQLITGLNNTLIIDDTYNSSPDSVFEALKSVQEIPEASRKRVWAVLGSMKELGALSRKGHEDVARAAELAADIIVGVGEEAKIIFETVAENKKKQAYWFENSEQAADYIKGKLVENDLIVAKGSQSARMEKIVKRLMAQPQQAPGLLVRQEKQWQ